MNSSENMNKDTTTNAQIKKIKKSLLRKFSLTNYEAQRFQSFNYLLIIKSLTKKSIRITLYPLENRDVLKLTIKAPNDHENMFLKVSEFLKLYEIIHAPGLIEINSNFLLECYIKGRFNTQELNHLYVFLENIKTPNTFLNIEKIKFKR